MLRRTSLTIFLLMGLGIASSAAGAVIDPGLQDAFKDKSAGELVRVLMLMDDFADLAPVEASLGKAASHHVRREAVVSALKAHAEATHAEALAILANAELTSGARHVRSLWLANAIAFKGSRDVVNVLAATDIKATLVFDKPYDMISGVTGPHRELKEDDGPSILQPASPAVPDTVWSVDWIDANRVWLDTGYTGSGIVVAHFDTGVWLTHPDLVNRLWVNPGEIPANFIDDDGNGYVDDVYGYDFADDDPSPNDDVGGGGFNHGTHTGGTVCGDGTNGTITGVAPGASLMVCKSMLSDGSGAPFSAIYEGQQYAIMMGARVFTMSLGIAGEIPPANMRTERNVANGIRAAGVIFFNSAGNDHFAYNPPLEIGLTARVPAPWNPIAGTPYSSLGGVVAVGGTGYFNNFAYNASSRGPVHWGDVAPWFDWPYNPGPGLIKPDVSAPGVNINSLQKPAGYTGDTWSGTSMSCPHAAGLAALMLEKNPTLSPAGVDSIMEQTALDLGTVGKDVIFGSGRIDALAAVNGVPADQMPHLVQTDVIIQDASGDGVIDPGEAFDLVFELTNNSPLVDATGVTAGLVVVANPHVALTDGSGSFGNIALGGGTGDNSGDVFSLTAGAGAPQGFEFTLFLTVYAQNGYEKTFDVKLFVGLPEWLDHDIGGVHLTVTDQGSIGYMGTAQIEGNGFGPIDGGTGLYIGSFWGGTDVNYICNNDFGNGDIAEWEVTESPNGRVRDLGAVLGDQTYQGIYADTGHSSPKPMVVTRLSYAWTSPPFDEFVIMQYTVRNDGPSTVNDYHVGIFCDFDIGGAYDDNEGDTDATRKLTYMRDGGSTSFYGIALLGDSPLKNLTMIHNPTYVYPSQHIDDGIKSRHLKGIMSLATTTGPDDWSCLTSAGPFSVAAGDSIVVALALVYGTSLQELQDNTDAANQALNPTPVTDLIPVKFNLSQNHPNPFNPATTIKFNVEHEGQVAIAVYDLSGRKVKSLVSQNYGVGEYSVMWDGTDDAGARMPSGMYVYRYESGSKSVAKKMMLVK